MEGNVLLSNLAQAVACGMLLSLNVFVLKALFGTGMFVINVATVKVIK